MGLALLKSRLHLDGKCISSVITEEEMTQYDVLPKHLDGIVNQLRVTKDVEVAVFLYETGDGTFKVSTRSREVADVSKVAVKYGGGGHVRAAGFSHDRRCGCHHRTDCFGSGRTDKVRK